MAGTEVSNGESPERTSAGRVWGKLAEPGAALSAPR
jgi:hypothetical protein